MKSLWILGVGLGLAWAQSVQVEVKGELAQVEAQALAALKANGLEPDRVLNLGEQIRQVTGASFPEYHLVVLKPEAGSLAAAAKNPMAAIVLPPTVYLHAAKAGVTTVGTFDGRLLFNLLGVAGPETDALVSRLEASLGRLGQLERIAPAVMPDPQSGMRPALLYFVSGAKAEDMVLLLEGELTARGLNLTPNLKVGPVTVILPCKSEWARIMFSAQPAGGFAAPCRFFAVDVPGGALVGAIEPMLMTIMPGVMGSPAVAMLQEAKKTITEVLESTGGVPYRPGQ
ncbi:MULTISPECIES: translation initiation factor 2 [unclassified Meiothermus]|uniref:translation initiation factor 2 n=1 Tax=unclassified Meiothermus TaxID=370471 RepID=UPI000D7CCC98|nr:MULTISPECIES: translation initiation factor 2 [unclassified Meiothermus]PZA05972.1 translation initiation factor 2 [Meiothermus sp. Pnk-1]RYM27528.1 translation initiation factor 2 [Meiothermus sp. PNK-Is4]